MKKKILFFMILLMVLEMPLFAAIFKRTTTKSSTTKTETESADDGKTRIALLVTGDLGDMSFWDSANEGMLRFQKDHPEVDVQIMELGSSDPTIYQSTLNKVVKDTYDLIIVGTADMRDPLKPIANNKKYADKRFIIFDTEIEDNKASKYSTVHSIMFKQNEGGYLAGVLATLMTDRLGKPNTAFIGGAENDIISDFGIGFVQGVQAANSYLGKRIGSYHDNIASFNDSPKGKTLAQKHYSDDVGILFAAASQSGIGCIEAAKQAGKYIIGVDSDQNAYYKDNPQMANVIVTSVEKRVGDALYEACERFLNGTLTYGDLEVLGIKEGKIALSDNANYRAKVPADIRNYMAKVISDISSGKITVKSGLKRYLGNATAERNAYYNSVAPTKR